MTEETVLDLDPTDDLTHGAQQLTFFNGHYGGWCYLPMLGFLSFDREAEQYLCAAVLRPGKAVAADGTLGLLCRLLPLLRAAFPRARFLVRLDGGFATPEIFDFLDAEPRLDYVVAMAKNAVLQRHAESAMQVARAQSEVRGETAHVYTDTRYAARTWDHERRVVIKAEVVRLGDREPRDNPRFVVTNLRQTPRFIYEKVYCARGDIENRIKELLDGLQIDRTSCCLFSANQLRVFLTAAAYVLMQELRLRAARDRGTGADTGTLTLTVDILPIPQVSDLTFDSRTTGTFAAGAGGVVLCEGGFELVDSTIPDTTPPSLVGAEVAVSGDEMALAFDEELAGVDSLHDLLASALSVTADGEPVPVDGYAYGGFGRIGRRLQLFLSSVITRGQTVVVSYADPTPGDDDVALQDLAGNDLASFTATATNNSAVEPVPALPLTGAGLLGLLLILLGGRRRPSG